MSNSSQKDSNKSNDLFYYNQRLIMSEKTRMLWNKASRLLKEKTGWGLVSGDTYVVTDNTLGFSEAHIRALAEAAENSDEFIAAAKSIIEDKDESRQSKLYRSKSSSESFGYVATAFLACLAAGHLKSWQQKYNWLRPSLAFFRYAVGLNDKAKEGYNKITTMSYNKIVTMSSLGELTTNVQKHFEDKTQFKFAPCSPQQTQQLRVQTLSGKTLAPKPFTSRQAFVDHVVGRYVASSKAQDQLTRAASKIAEANLYIEDNKTLFHVFLYETDKGLVVLILSVLMEVVSLGKTWDGESKVFDAIEKNALAVSKNYKPLRQIKKARQTK